MSVQSELSAPRCLLRTLTGIKLLSTGSYVPEEVVSNEDLAELGFVWDQAVDTGEAR